MTATSFCTHRINVLLHVVLFFPSLLKHTRRLRKGMNHSKWALFCSATLSECAFLRSYAPLYSL
ncbi:hypothetical protein CUMW_021610 [Citrus unshiu]|nr:hypothetical protein CUMW_021610 [Citrus unshiu]